MGPETATDTHGNHLSGQTSPYLAAHSHDPVDWRPWGEDAFALAIDTSRPIFLSIGYQSCHWCHVMQRESFKDEATAETLNRDFVPVKVDRELRPDIDALYMSYVTATTGSGGWPMSVFLTPDLKPFFGGTYFPKASPHPKIPAFADVLDITGRSWRESQEHTVDVARDAMDFLRVQQAPKGPGAFDPAFVDAAAARILASKDDTHGGFGGAPKFPQASVIAFLLAYHDTVASEEALNAAIHAVLSMIRGGAYDQVGGGLFRYSTDDEWLVPHFEKMLYDQALLLSNLAGLESAAPAEEWVRVAGQTASFLARELSWDTGGFASSLDAETHGVEGETYVWTEDALAALLTDDELRLAREHLGVRTSGNWERGQNILTRRKGRYGEAVQVDALLEKLRVVRAERAQPAVITNTLTGWNALTARGLMEAGAAAGDEQMGAMGRATLDWLLAAAVDGDDVRHALDDPSVDGVHILEDYAALAGACVVAGLVYEDDGFMATAARLHQIAQDRFETGDGFGMTTAEELPLVPLEQSDSPTPAGVSLLAENERRLAWADGRDPDEGLLEAVQRQMRASARIAPHMAGWALAQAL